MAMKGGEQYVTNAHVLRRELVAKQKQRRLQENALKYTARRKVIDEFSPDKVRNFAALDIANKHTKFEIDRPSIMQGQMNKRDPFGTIVHTEVNPMDVPYRPGPAEYSPKHPSVGVKDAHRQHGSFSSKSPQLSKIRKAHTNDTIIAAPTTTRNGQPLRRRQSARIGSAKRDTSMVQYHLLHQYDEEKAKKTQARRERLKKKEIIQPKAQFVEPGLLGPVREERYPANIIRSQTTVLGPGFYEPKVHPKKLTVKEPHKKSMAFLKTGRRSGPSDWTLNYVPKKDPFHEAKKDIFSRRDMLANGYTPDAMFFDNPYEIKDEVVKKKALKQKLKQEEVSDETFIPRVPICEDPRRMQPILATLSQIEHDTRKDLVNETTERYKKIQRVRNVIATTRFLSQAGRRKNIAELTKTFRMRGTLSK